MNSHLKAVINTWAGSLIFLGGHYRKLGQFILLPIVALSFLGVASHYVGGVLLLSVVAQLVLYVMFSVAWHNYILKPDGKSNWQYLRWNRNKWLYLGLVMLLGFIFLSVMSLLGRPSMWLVHSLNVLSQAFSQPPVLAGLPTPTVGVGDLLSLVAMLGISLPMSRMMFMLPAVAVEGEFQFRQIWQMTDKAVVFCFLLFVTLLLSQMLFGYAGVVLRYLMADIGGDGLSVALINELIWHSFNYVTIALSVTPLSLAYGYLTRE